MKEHITRGIICLQDEYQFVYRIAAISYTIWEDGSFAYVFRHAAGEFVSGHTGSGFVCPQEKLHSKEYHPCIHQ